MFFHDEAKILNVFSAKQIRHDWKIRLFKTYPNEKTQ